MKQIRKILSLLLVLALILSCGMVSAADAEKTADIVSKDAVLVRSVDTVPKTALDILQANGADIQEKTIIEVLRIDGTEDTAICVTNTNGPLVKKDLLLGYTEAEDRSIVVDNSFANALAESNSRNSPTFSTTWSTGYVMNISAYAYTYTVSLKTYYRPYQCSFRYSDSAGANIANMKVEYLSEGWLYKIENGSYIDMNSTYEYSIIASQALPVAGVTYSQTSAFPSNYCLYLDTGALGIGSFTLITNVVNGTTHTASIRLI